MFVFCCLQGITERKSDFGVRHGKSHKADAEKCHEVAQVIKKGDKEGFYDIIENTTGMVDLPKA
jgi:hypothetical protein